MGLPKANKFKNEHNYNNNANHVKNAITAHANHP